MGCLYSYKIDITESKIYLERHTCCGFIDNTLLLEDKKINNDKNSIYFINIINKILYEGKIKNLIGIFNLGVDDILSKLKKELKYEKENIENYMDKFGKFKNDINDIHNIKECVNIFNFIYSKKDKIEEETMKGFIEHMRIFVKIINEANKGEPLFDKRQIDFFEKYLYELFKLKKNECNTSSFNNKSNNKSSHSNKNNSETEIKINNYNMEDVKEVLGKKNNSDKSSNSTQKLREEREKNKQLEEKNKILEKNNKLLEEKYKQIEEKNKNLENQILEINRKLDNFLLKKKNSDLIKNTEGENDEEYNSDGFLNEPLV